ncbi:glycosyltransferase family 32 protein [uncultured Ruminococcus sp.]|uniref:glycosyltransferase family 32 protein n=1 Tax=uncultured Ruminococcus sp. TaxID=165186 RepID=UPI0025FA1512|nr:glycosyltransferase [uncultured Ruminococcus sp.]
MIPKKIHYCWFGRGELTSKAKKCIDSWKKYCPDYEIIEWNEDNFDINQNEYTKMCYSEKKFAFLSDYARLMVVYQNGGIYFDVDVEVIRNFDDLLDNKAFFGFETNEYVASGLGFGAEKENPVVKTMIDEYEQLLDGKHGTIGCPILNTKALEKHGLILNGEMQHLDYATVYPICCFNPYDDPTGRLNKTDDTYSIHWFQKSWMSTKSKIRSKLMKPIHRIVRK